ncbi:polyphenol oxidase family protein [Desulfobaculum senezii]|jgi:hypothetical protein|uniref:polyphenol oxidase family protein n=1 Tax=Desulfobaculum sp. SPO524 TaxID=3378071 RepID=UPI003854C554
MDMSYIPFQFPGLDKVNCYFGTRMGGDDKGPFDNANISLEVGDNPDHVIESRKALQRQLGFETWQEVRQVHGPQMIFEPEPTDIEVEGSIEADGIATTAPGRALIIKTADCQPILLAHASGKYVAALHVGWRGNALHFPTSGVKAFCREYDLPPEEVYAVRGPSLGPGWSQFQNFHDEFGKAFKDYFDPDTASVDLWRLTRDQLLSAGIRPGHIFGLDLCTYSLPEMFFSYRRNNTCGRMASMIWIEK